MDNVPQDIEILQLFIKHKNLDSLLDKLSYEDVVYMDTMVSSLYIVIRHRLLNLEATAELPTADDRYMDFCYYCLSLPRERILSLINNPCYELKEDRLYYVNLNGKTYQNEGYLSSDISEYMRKKYKVFINQDMSYEDALIFLNSYYDILIDKIKIPISNDYYSIC